MADEKQTKVGTDPQIQALMRASGHNIDDTILILNELNKLGWTVRPITGFLGAWSAKHD